MLRVRLSSCFRSRALGFFRSRAARWRLRRVAAAAAKRLPKPPKAAPAAADAPESQQTLLSRQRPDSHVDPRSIRLCPNPPPAFIAFARAATQLRECLVQVLQFPSRGCSFARRPAAEGGAKRRSRQRDEVARRYDARDAPELEQALLQGLPAQFCRLLAQRRALISEEVACAAGRQLNAAFKSYGRLAQHFLRNLGTMLFPIRRKLRLRQRVAASLLANAGPTINPLRFQRWADESFIGRASCAARRRRARIGRTISDFCA